MELSRNLQIATAAIDSTGMCLFIAFAILDQPETFQAMLDLLSAFSGVPLTADGERIPPGGHLRVWRSADGGATFTAGSTYQVDITPPATSDKS